MISIAKRNAYRLTAWRAHAVINRAPQGVLPAKGSSLTVRQRRFSAIVIPGRTPPVALAPSRVVSETFAKRAKASRVLSFSGLYPSGLGRFAWAA